MRELSDLLTRIVIVIEGLDLRYFVTGSVASMYYGEARLTHDVDIVVDLPLGAVKRFCASFPNDEFYVSEDAARDAVMRVSQFNIVHPESGLKADIMILSGGEQDQMRLARAGRVAAHGVEAVFSSPEDVIISKLDFYRQGGSEKHIRDIVSMVKILGDKLDFAYIEQWVIRLDLSKEWHTLRQRAAGPPNV